jgi:hypothetical protein
MTNMNSDSIAMFYLGYFCVGIKHNFKETREIRYQTLKRKSRSAEHAIIKHNDMAEITADAFI